MKACTYGPAERKRQSQISTGGTAVAVVRRCVSRRGIAAQRKRIPAQHGAGDVAERTVVQVRVGLVDLSGLVVAAARFSAGRQRGRGPGHRLLLRLLLLSALIFAQAHLEQRVALGRARALQRRRVESAGRGRLLLLRGGRGAATAAATLARGQLAAVVFDLQYLQFEEAQTLDVLCARKPTENKKQEQDESIIHRLTFHVTQTYIIYCINTRPFIHIITRRVFSVMVHCGNLL